MFCFSMRPFSSPEKSTASLASIQILRALAALSVCLGHSLHEALGFEHTEILTHTESLPWRMGVDLFFIISGFIMMFTAHATFHRSGAPRSFALRRLIRIVPPYWFFTSLMVGAALLVPEKLDTTSFSVPHALLSYLFIPHHQPGTIDGIHPILGAGWTLLYEMFFYLVFALALFFPRRLGLGLIVVSFVALFAAARSGLLSTTLTTFWGDSILFEFLLGIGTYYVLASSWSPLHKTASIVLFAGGAYAIACLFSIQDERFFDLGMPALALFGLIAPLRIPNKGLFLLFVLIGDASYTLYLSHPFAIEIAKQILIRLFSGSVQEAWFIPLFTAVCLLATVSGAIVFYLLCEKPTTGYLRHVFRTRLSKDAPKAGL